MKKTLLFVLLCLCIVIMVGCGEKQESSQNPAGSAEKGRLSIAVIPKGTLHEFWRTVHAGAAKAGQELGVDVSWRC